MKHKISLLNITLIIIGAIVLIYGIFQKSESTVLANEIEQAVVQADSEKVDPKNEGKLVILSGHISANGELRDDYFKISQKTIKLKRVVETYQWIEDCSTQCTYLKTWSEELIDSSKFDSAHKNPDTKQYSSEEYIQDKTQMGSFSLTKTLVDKLHYDTVYGPDEIIDEYKGNYELLGEYITNVTDMNNPNIGDFRIHYEYVKDKDVTVVAKQAGQTFEPFYTDKNKEIYDISDGIQSANEYVAKIKKSNSALGIVLSVIGGAFILFGVAAIVFDELKARKQGK